MKEISFEAARALVRKELAPGWTLGTLYVAPWGYEDNFQYQLIAGARENLVDDNEDFLDTSGLVYLVDKDDGTIESVFYQENSEELDAMRPIGNPPA